MSPKSTDDEEKDIGQSQREHPSSQDTTQSHDPEKQTSNNASHNDDDQKKLDDWDSPGDADNPLNWPTSKKAYHTLIPSTIAFVCTLGSSIITPGQESIMSDLGVSMEVSLLPYVLYVIGLAFGPMLAAPLSETFGRRAVYWTGMPVFMLFTLGAGFSNNIAALCICRFFSAVFGSPGLSIGSATISDIWTPLQRAAPMTFYVTTPFLGPAIGPLVGGFVAEKMGWRWTVWTLLFFEVACLSPALFMKETYKKAILRKRAKARGLRYPEPERTPVQAAKFFLRSTLTRPAHMFCVEPVVLCFTSYVSINFGTLYAFFAAFPYVFETQYGFGLGQVGLFFIGLGVGSTAGGAFIIVFSKLMYGRKIAQHGKVPPEAKLYLAMIGSLCLPVSLFWFGWTTQEKVHWMAPVVAEAIFGFGNLLIFMSSVLYVMDFYGMLSLDYDLRLEHY